MDAPLTIGQRVASFRKAAGLSRADLAARIDCSTDTLKSYELGRRSLDAYTTIEKIADALGIDVTELLGRPPRLPSPETRAAHLAIPAVRRILLQAQLPGGPTGAPMPLAGLQARVDESSRLRRHARYGELGASLPELLTDLTVTAATTSGADRAAAYRLLAEARHDTTMMTKKLGYVDLAALAAMQALQAAYVTEDPLLVTAMEWTQAEVCMSAGATAEAEGLIRAGLDRLDPLLGDDTDTWSLWGTLQMVLAVVDAKRGGRADAAEHLAEAAAAAGRLGTAEPGYQTEFSAGNQALHAMHVGLELGEDLEPLERIRHVNLSMLPRERRGRHGIDRARARARAGDDAGAMEELLAADRISPEGVRSHPLTQELVVSAAQRARQVGPVAEAARRMHIAI